MSNSLATLASPIGDTDGYSVATGATLGQWPGPLTTDFQRVKDTFNLGTTRNRQPGVCKDWDGTTQYATLPSAIGLTGAFAVSVWVNPDAVNTRSIIGGATDAHIQLTLTGYSVRLINAGSVVTGGSALATGAWSHLLFERDGANSITVRVNNALRPRSVQFLAQPSLIVLQQPQPPLYSMGRCTTSASSIGS